MFEEYKIVFESEKTLFVEEIKYCIKDFAIKNDLKLNGEIERTDYLYFFRPFGEKPAIENTIFFRARKKTKDELFTEQIDFQIKQMSV